MEMRDLAFNHLVWQESISNPGLPTPSMCSQAAMLPGRGTPLLPAFEVGLGGKNCPLPSARTAHGVEARGLGCRVRARNKFSPLLGSAHFGETDHRSHSRPVSHLLTTLPLLLLFFFKTPCVSGKTHLYLLSVWSWIGNDHPK